MKNKLKMLKMIVHHIRPGSNAQYCLLKSNGVCVDNYGKTIIDVPRLIYWRDNEPEKFGDYQKNALRAAIEYLKADNKCACGGGECEHSRELLNTRHTMKDTLGFGGYTCKKVDPEAPMAGKCHDCEREEQPLEYYHQLYENELGRETVQGYCKSCIEKYEMRPFLALKYEGKYYNLSKDFFMTTICYFCEIETVCLEYVASRFEHFRCCHTCASKYQGQDQCKLEENDNVIEIRFIYEEECVVCLDAKPTVGIVPCGHVSMCEACSPAFSSCPMCRQKATHKILKES